MNNDNNGVSEEVITRKIKPEEQGQYIEVKFQLPQEIEKFTVKMEVFSKESEETVIDLGVKDPYRVRGWSGGARSSFYVSEEHATPGYLSGKLHDGEWAVLLGTYRVGANGCEVVLTIHYTEKKFRWLCGDLHLHSVHSDGSYTLNESISIATEAGLDFIALTDHNTASQNLARPRNTDITLIPGMELTTNNGHLNLLGADDPVKDFRVNSNEELAEKLKEARTHDVSITLNHPYCSNTGWHWDWDFDYDFVEVWNGPWREDNAKAVKWWHEQLVQGKRLVAISGSDTHNPDKYRKHGMPTTWVYSKSNSVEDILSSIHSGQVIMTYKRDAPFIELNCGDKGVGEICTNIDEDTTVSISRLEKNDIVKIYSNNGLELEETISEVEEKKIFQLSDARKFYRVEVWRYIPPFEQPLLVSLSNPIYFEN